MPRSASSWLSPESLASITACAAWPLASFSADLTVQGRDPAFFRQQRPGPFVYDP
jgi:hypothetical protein